MRELLMNTFVKSSQFYILSHLQNLSNRNSLDIFNEDDVFHRPFFLVFLLHFAVCWCRLPLSLYIIVIIFITAI